MATALIQQLEGQPGELVLPLDDYHLIESAAIRDSLAFLRRHLPEATCGHRVGALEQEILALPTHGDLDVLRRQLERAIADAAPEQLKRLLDAVVERITVESRACIQPYFLRPRFVRVPLRGGGRRRVRTRASRRRASGSLHGPGGD